MVKLDVRLNSGSYPIYIGSDIWTDLTTYIRERDHVVVITDQTVDGLYGSKLDFPKIVIVPGEGSKNLAIVEHITEKMLDEGLTRQSAVIALGGGVVGDIAGFCASVYMRGIEYVQVPTTLLSQVDSSVGGKTAVNSQHAKNVIGTFYQPSAVFIDPAFQRTLPPHELVNGLAEVIKYGIITDGEFLDYIVDNLGAFLESDLTVVTEIIARCCQIKADVVATDEKEGGLRRILNYGHTIAHGLEAITHYRGYSHGQAVLIGMLYEARLALIMGMLDLRSYQKIEGVLRLFKLDWDISGFSFDDLVQVMMKDKKNRCGKLSFMLPTRIGAVQERLISRDELRHYRKDLIAHR